MGRLNFPNSEHNKIRTSRGVRAELAKLAERIAAEAGSIAGAPDGYQTDMTVGSDRARAHVWAESSEAIRAEIKTAPLLQIVGNAGADAAKGGRK